MSKSALILVDVQLGMYNREMIPPIFQGDEKIKKMAELVAKARKAGQVVIYIRHVGEEGHPLEQDKKDSKSTRGSPLVRMITS